MAVAERPPAPKRGGPTVDVGTLVERMQAAAVAAIGSELDSLAHDPGRISGVMIEFEVEPGGQIEAAHFHVTRRAKGGPLRG